MSFNIPNSGLSKEYNKNLDVRLANVWFASRIPRGDTNPEAIYESERCMKNSRIVRWMALALGYSFPKGIYVEGVDWQEASTLLFCPMLNINEYFRLIN